MTTNKDELKKLLDFSLELARAAGEITLQFFRKDVDVNRKKDGSFVTEVDFKTEKFLRASIAEKFPDDGILGEEEGESLGSTGRRWIIDPIDGTFSFVHGVPMYGVLIGLEIDGESVVGVINLPALNEIVYAAKGLGCYCNNEPARV